MNKLWVYMFITWIALSSISFFIEGVSAAPNSDDFYALLEVPRQAAKADIKKKYRNLSKKYHPDKNRGDEAASDLYKSINRAYEVLADDERRQAYDAGGIDALEKFERGEGHIQKGPSARADISITLEEMYLGTTRKMNINRNVYCETCRGSGAKDGKLKTCPKCKGQGVVLQMVNMGMMQMQMQQPCPICQGKGKTMAAKCGKCRGGRLIQESTMIEIDINKGAAKGDTILFEKEGEQVPDLARGDLIFTIKQKPNSRFKRVGNNLYMDMHISLAESLFGFKRTVSHLDLEKFEVTSKENEIIQPDQWLILKGKGMPLKDDPMSYGDLHIKMKVKMPTKLTEDQIKQIEEVLREAPAEKAEKDTEKDQIQTDEL